MNTNTIISYYFFAILVGLYFIVELTVGLVFQSIALQTDAFHMLSDLFALIISIISLRLSKKQRTDTHTYGWIRAEIIGGLINSVFLLAICFLLFLESIEKMVEEKDTVVLKKNIDAVLVTAGIGLVINVVGLMAFHNPDRSEGTHRTHNHSAVSLHILGDLLGSVVVIGSGLAIKFGEGNWVFWLDPVASIIIIMFISVSSLKLAKQTTKILLHVIPSNVEQEALLQELKGVEGVLNIHEFHLWSLTSDIIIASSHVKIAGNQEIILLKIKRVLHDYEVHSSSIQIETAECPVCDEECQALRCCQSERSEDPTRSKADKTLY